MNFGKKGPYILIILLVVILIFILGVQYGKRVKIADSAISFLLSITPSPIPKPSQLPVTKYTPYVHDGCQVEFLYPSYLKIQNEASKEATFSSQDKKQFIELSCPSKLPERPESTISATVMTIDGIRSNSFEGKVKVKNEYIPVRIIQINRPSSPLEFTINSELEPLITTSIDLQ